MPSRRKFMGITYAGASASDHCPKADQSLGEFAPPAAEDLVVRPVG